ncbi:2OG-Fe(II) oxygenase [Tenacibaculum sp. TC6]|uniref:2OG-Fe(II) oxygenase n=1 Tax=Tenacibaculum sp. TC6 TaxID=3423223 RepID=UPI003D35D621
MQTIVNELHEQQYERLITGLISNEFGICDNFFSADIIEELRKNLLNNYEEGIMYRAGIGKDSEYTKDKEIRRDVICWIDEKSENVTERLFIQKMNEFVEYLNKTCYTSINAFEFHYAYYDVGSFYKRHVDQFKNDNGRLFSFVMYLNDNWQFNDGGELVLYTQQQTEIILPIGGRVAFFKSDVIEHEVKVALTKPRLSIVGWMKNV